MYIFDFIISRFENIKGKTMKVILNKQINLIDDS